MQAASRAPAIGAAAASDDSADRLLRAYRDNAAAVHAFFCYYVPEQVAEDLTASTFERVVRFWERFDPEAGSPRTWIFAISRNVLADHFRRQSYRNAVSLDQYPGLAASLVASDDPTARLLCADGVRNWLETLDQRQREVLALRFAADWTAAEVARHLQLSEANVHQISSRALRRLHDRIVTRTSPARPDLPRRSRAVRRKAGPHGRRRDEPAATAL